MTILNKYNSYKTISSCQFLSSWLKLLETFPTSFGVTHYYHEQFLHVIHRSGNSGRVTTLRGCSKLLHYSKNVKLNLKSTPVKIDIFYSISGLSQSLYRLRSGDTSTVFSLLQRLSFVVTCRSLRV